jgi:hypothetical protein
MIQREAIDRLIADLQAAALAYDEVDAVVAKHAKAKAEHETVARELTQFRRELSDLKLEYQDKRQQLGQLMADIVRRTGELQRIDSQIQQAKQRAFGG